MPRSIPENRAAGPKAAPLSGPKPKSARASLNGIPTPSPSPGKKADESGRPLRPAIEITTEEKVVNDAAAAALANARGLFQRMNQLVRVVTDRKPAHGISRPLLPRIEPLPASLLREELAHQVLWQKSGAKGEPKPAHPPEWCVAAVFDRGEWPGVKYLEGVVDYPVLRADGTVAAAPGYDPTTGLLLMFPKDRFVVPERPSHRDAVAARDELLEAVADFPFRGAADRASWLAALLTPLARFVYAGPAPLFLADANTRGAGKGLLLDVIALVVAGQKHTVATYTDDEDELRRRITGLVREGDRLVLFDNLTGRFGNGTLNAALTGDQWTDRRLGTNSSVRGPLLMTWYATGNNVALDEDTARRVCPIRLESPMERPELREGFRHPRLTTWVRKNRPRLLAAALTVLRAYHLAGRPDMGLEPWGSFEEWSAFVRAAVVWLDLPDPGEARQLLRRRADPETESMGLLLAAWEEMDPKGRGKTVAEVVRLLYADAAEPPAWHARLKAAAEALTGQDRVTTRVLAARLQRFQRRVIAGRYIDQVGKVTNALRWAAFPADSLAG
jgi:hypothetical protein